MPNLSLNDSIKWVKGVGPYKAKLLERIYVKTIREIIYLPPRRYLDRSEIKQIKDINVGEEVTIEGDIVSKSNKKSRKNTLVTDIVVYDGSGIITCRYFNQEWVYKHFKKGQHLFFSGKIDYFRGFQIINPDYEILTEEEKVLIHTGRIIPIYPLTKGLGQRFMRKTINYVISEVLNKIQDPFPRNLLKKHNLITLKKAIQNLHFPSSKELIFKSKRRFAFDELFYFQLFLSLRKEARKKYNGFSFNTNSSLEKKFLSSLQFSLTSSQKKVLSEIKNDMRAKTPMNRLLQGDVGSGKTVIALASMLIAVDNGFYSVLMAPTEILAYQHYFVLKELTSSLPMSIWLLVGGMTQREKEEIFNEMQNKRGIIIGTHALLEEEIEIPNLGMVVIDEQHRFGVEQRAKILKKGNKPDTLVMTATPIPRTLALSIYGDLEVSTIDEMPPGKVIPHSRWVKEENKRKDIYHWIYNEVRKKEIKAYIVLPLIEESEKMDLYSIEKEADLLIKNFFPDLKVGVLHGRINRDEKERIMSGFRGSEFNILITTTVIEVGIDIPKANIMIVENADRFGLAQLHQLRGRIGRAGGKAYFILIAPEENITENSKTRLNALETITNGFKLAEIDLKLRGPGEFFGTRQHGFPDFKFFNPIKDRNLIGRVRNSVNEILTKKLEYKFIDKIKKIQKAAEFVDVG
jgi:ATP-dependent DNA helicase RecG